MQNEITSDPEGELLKTSGVIRQYKRLPSGKRDYQY